MKAADYAVLLRAELAHNWQALIGERNELDAEAEALKERERNIQEDARLMAEYALADAQHAVNVALSYRLAHVKLGPMSQPPTEKDVRRALKAFNATEDVFRLARACLEPHDAAMALVALYESVTKDAEESAALAAREAALDKVLSAQREAEYAEQVKLQQKLEA